MKRNETFIVRVKPHFLDGWRSDATISIRKLEPKDESIMGRILVNHLIIEHYLDRYIRTLSPSEFVWEETRMSFSQKIKLVSGRDSMFFQNGLLPGLREINTLRNRIAHRLDGQIESRDTAKMASFLRKCIPKRIKLPTRPVDIVDGFTAIMVSNLMGFILGFEACTDPALMSKFKDKLKIVKLPGKRGRSEIGSRENVLKTNELLIP